MLAKVAIRIMTLFAAHAVKRLHRWRGRARERYVCGLEVCDVHPCQHAHDQLLFRGFEMKEATFVENLAFHSG